MLAPLQMMATVVSLDSDKIDSSNFLEVGLYEGLISSQCITYSTWWSARPQFRRAGSCIDKDDEQYVIM